MTDTLTNTPTHTPLAHWSRSPAAKLGLALLLILVLQIPLLAVSSLIDERQSRQEEVLSGIRRSWGPAQSLSALTLAIPYSWIDPATGTVPAQRREAWVQVPARQLAIEATLAPETRQRGLFHATVYTAEVQIDGMVGVPKIDLKDAPAAELHWEGAVLAIGATDLRGQPAGGVMALNGQAAPLVVQRTGGGCGGVASASAGFTGPVPPGTQLTVRAHLTLRGTQSFVVAPWGEGIDLRVAAPWQTPGFNGSAPLHYDIAKAGFRAGWQAVGDAVGSTWRRGPAPTPECAAFNREDGLGVDLLEAVPTYLMVTRAAKYGTLFLVLAFLTYFLIEQTTGLRIHIAQYALLGVSVSLFALLLVSLAEPLGFTAGYALSTAAVLGQASLYTLSVTQRPRLAGLFAGLLGLLFAVLYVVLRLESYALLSGAVTVFATLSVVMAATRRLDWSGRTAGA